MIRSANMLVIALLGSAIMWLAVVAAAWFGDLTVALIVIGILVVLTLSLGVRSR